MFKKIISKLKFNNNKINLDITLSEDDIERATKLTNKYPLPIITIELPQNPSIEEHEMWANLTSLLVNEKATVLNISSETTQLINEAIDLRDIKTFSQRVAIIRNADLHIGVVSKLMYATAKINRAAIILFNEDEKPSQYRYKNIIKIKNSEENTTVARDIFIETQKLINFKALGKNSL